MNDNKTPLEMPDNKPESTSKPIMSKGGDSKQSKKMNAVKIAYAFALLLAIGGAFAAKIATENALGELKVPLESDYVTVSPTLEPTEEPDYEVRNNLTDVPDTRGEATTEKSTEPAEISTTLPQTTSPYATPYEDKFFSPTGSKVINKFENTKPLYNETLGEWRTHPAVDYKCAEGGAVSAIAYGEVENIYDDALYGTVIEIHHGNGLFARYCGLNKDTLEVQKGDTVDSQQLLGYLGSIPAESKADSHLHLELLREGTFIDGAEIIE